MVNIEEISLEQAERLCRDITSDLPEYFGLPKINEHYAVGVRSRKNRAAKIDGHYVGLLSLDFPYPNTSNIYWMGIFRKYHTQGIGHKLIEAGFQLAKDNGANSMTVETLSPSESDENYLKTYQFYQSCGFEPLFNLKPQGYEWNMVYMVRNLNHVYFNRSEKNIEIRAFKKSDIPIIVASFEIHNWSKPQSIFENYLQEQDVGERLIWVAHVNDTFAGYVTLKWLSKYKPFSDKQIPEIIDLNVLSPFRNCGIGSKLLETAEELAATKSTTVGIGVGLYGGPDGGYGPAQKLYVKRGFIPDARGVTYDYQNVIPGNNVSVDDDLVLWFIKRLI